MAGSRLFTLALLIALGTLSACRDDSPPPQAGPVDAVAAAVRDCTRSGGRMVASKTLSGMQICLRDTGEEGKSCTNSRACEGDCLARSRTCSPVVPLYGCNEILMDDGRKATLCRD